MRVLKKITSVSSVLIMILLWQPSAYAGFITLSPTTAVTNVANGDQVTFDITFDFSNEATIGGGFDIVFDSNALAFQSFDFFPVGDPVFSREPDILPGLLSGWAIGEFFGLLGIFQLGQVTFEVLASMGPTTSVSVTDTQSVAGPFVSSVTFIPMDVTYNQVTVERAVVAQPASEPSTVLLMGLAILLAGLSNLKGFPKIQQRIKS